MVTNHGQVDGYILSPENFDRLVEAEELLKNLSTLDESISDIQAGRTFPIRKAIKDVAHEIGLELES